MLNNDDGLVIFDIGERYIKAMFVRKNWKNELEFVYSTQNHSKGISFNTIYNLINLSEYLFKLIYRIEIDVGIVVKSVVVMFSCVEVQKKIFNHSINIHNFVNQDDLDNLNYKIKIQEEEDEIIIGNLYKNYSINKLKGIENPLHMNGTNLTINNCLFMINNVILKNIVASLNRNDMNVKYIGYGNLVVYEFIKEDDFVSIDMGYSTTRIMLKIKEDSINDFFDIPIGFKNLIYTIQKTKGCSLLEAENMINISFDEHNHEVINICRSFFKNLFEQILLDLNKFSYLNKNDVPILLYGGITTIPLINVFLKQVFDRNFMLYEVKEKFICEYNRNIFRNIVSMAHYINDNKDYKNIITI